MKIISSLRLDMPGCVYESIREQFAECSGMGTKIPKPRETMRGLVGEVA